MKKFALFFSFALASCLSPSAPDFGVLEMFDAPDAGALTRRPQSRRRIAPPIVTTPVVFDFTSGSVPSGITATTSGDTVYAMRSSGTQVVAVTPGAGVGIFEDRGNGTGILVAPSWSNVIVTDFGAAFPFALSSWDHNGVGNVTKTANQADGPAPAGTGLGNADLITAINPATQGKINLFCSTLSGGDAFGSVWFRDFAGNLPTSPGAFHGTPNGDKDTDRAPGTTTWTQLRWQGNGGAYSEIYPAGDFGTNGPTGGALVWGAQMGAGRYQLPLVSGATTATASAASLTVDDPSSFVVNGNFYASGKFKAITDAPGSLVIGTGYPPRYLFSAETPGGKVSLRTQYSSAGSSSVDWIFEANGSDVITAAYGVGVTTPGVGALYLGEVSWQVAYDHTAGDAWMFVCLGGSCRLHRATGISSSVSTPTSFYVHSNVGADVMPALVREVRAPRSRSLIVRPSILVVGDSQMDVTDASVTIVPTRPTNYVLTDTEVKAGKAILSTAVHGNTFAQQQTALAAIPSSFTSSIEAVTIAMGYNDFAANSNATTRTNCQSLLTYASTRFAGKVIQLHVPTPAKAGVSGTTYGRSVEFKDDVAGSYYTGSTRNITTLWTTYNDGSDNLLPDTADHLHYNDSLKRLIGATMRAEYVTDGIL